MAGGTAATFPSLRGRRPWQSINCAPLPKCLVTWQYLATAHPTLRGLLKQPCVYLLASRSHGTLYVGVTSDLIKRVWQHKNNLVEGFTSKYHVHVLVWFEQHATMELAIAREKQLKAGNRNRKIALIEATNPNWLDLYESLLG